MHPFTLLYGLGLLGLAGIAAAVAQPVQTLQPVAAAPPKLALLVGCTEYQKHPLLRLRPLQGPPNDVRLWNKLLTEGFAFPQENITRLVGWPEKEEDRPTAANIRKGFESLIARAQPGSQVVIVMSGHGAQVPLSTGADPLDPKNYEPDGLDEVFLPADVQMADADGQLPDAIRDDEFGAWLDRLRDKGTHVLIVFDCCHSGTMTRGGDTPREVSRAADPATLGIKPERVADSVEAARKAVEKAKAEGRPVPPESDIRPADPAKPRNGSLVAFYAAQPFEEAPELPLPEDKPPTPENWYGLLSFTLIQAIEHRQSALTYRELGQYLTAGYQASRGGRGPSAYAEGDLDREVLGYKTWPNRPDIFLRVAPKMPLAVSAGHLRGVTKDSVLAVHPPAGMGDVKEVLGYVKVEKAELNTAEVSPIAFGPLKIAIEREKLQNLSRCSIASRSLSEFRVKLFVEPAARPAFDALATLGDDGKEVQNMFLPPDQVPANQAEWALRVVNPKQAADLYGLAGLKGDHVLLVPGEGRQKDPAAEKVLADRLKAEGKPLPRRVFAAYPVPAANNDRSVTDFLNRDLPKVFRWQSLWKVGNGLTDEGVRVKFSVTRANGAPIQAGEVLANKTTLEFRVKNNTAEKLWVVPVVIGSDLEIDVRDVVQVEGFKEILFLKVPIELSPGSYGTEGMVLFVIPQAAHPLSPDYRFMAQRALTVTEAKKRGADPFPDTPFGSLMKSATLGGKGTRGVGQEEPTTPSAIIQTWYAVP